MTSEDPGSRRSGPLAGIKVVELASWMFVPSAGTVLVDWGADVVKVEHPVTGDPQRGLVTSGLLPGGDSGINFMMEQPNRASGRSPSTSPSPTATRRS